MTSQRLSCAACGVWLRLLLVFILGATLGESRPWANVSRQLAGVNVKQLQRLQFIKLHILHSLGFSEGKATPDTSLKAARLGDVGRMRASDVATSGGHEGVGSPQEIISLSEVLSEANGGALLQFNIHPKQREHLQVVSAHLWVKVRKRRGSRRPKTVEIRVFQVEEGRQSMLSYLRTRIKKTRWRQLSLPISLVQRLLESSQGSLQLRLECKRCGRLARLVLPWSRKARARAKARKRSKKFRRASLSQHHRHRHSKTNSTEEAARMSSTSTSSQPPGRNGSAEGAERVTSQKSAGAVASQDARPAPAQRHQTFPGRPRGGRKRKRQQKKRARSLNSGRSRPKRPRQPYLVINAREK